MWSHYLFRSVDAGERNAYADVRVNRHIIKVDTRFNSKK